MSVISKTSDWDTQQISLFLTDTTIPIRLAVIDGDTPLICSLWFAFDQQQLVCVSHKDSKITRLLQDVGRCGFEVATNEAPYHGIRGKATVEVVANSPESRLRGLIEHYLGDTNQKLANWLLRRVDDECEIRLTPTWITAWDYSHRMDRG